MKVIVVGAGISGLSAAWELQCTGHDAVVVERSGRAGGRLVSAPFGGVTVERGAQLLPSHARVIPALARRVGLSIRTASTPPALYWRGKLRPVDVDHPWSLFTGGVLPWGSLGRAMMGLSRMRRADSRPTDDLAAWAELDATTARDWCRATFGAAVTNRLLDSAVKTHLQSLDGSATALAAAVAHNCGANQAATIDGGLEALPAALADRLTVQFETSVERIRVVDGRPEVDTEAGTMTADRVILAVSGPQAAALWPDAGPDEVALMNTPYRPGLVVNLSYDQTLPPEVLAGASSALMPPGSDLVSVLVASRSGSSVTRGDALTAIFNGPAADALITETDETIIDRARGAIDELQPGLGAAAGAAQITRWSHATPSVPPGHATRVRQYRARLNPKAPVVLAGDYLGFPWSDSAARGGIWAARCVTGSHRANECGNGTARREQTVG